MKVADIVTERIVTMLEEGTAPWAKPWSANCQPMRYSGQPYRGINSVLLQSDKYASTIWLTGRMIVDNGGQKKDGEVAGGIAVFYNYPTKAQRDAGKRPFMRYYSVYNYDQTEGVPLPEWYSAPREFTPIESAAAIIANMPQLPDITHGGDRAYYRPSNDSVQLPTPESFTEPTDYYSVAFHELAHSTGHDSRLARGYSANFGSEPYSKEELIAELAASMLCAEIGINSDTSERRSAAYLKGWINALKGDSSLIASAASAAQRAADFIAGQGKAEPEAEPEAESAAA